MADETDNLVLRLLQELRAELQSVSAKVGHIDERFTELKQSVDGNMLTFNLVAGVAYDHEQRIAMLEERRLPRP